MHLARPCSLVLYARTICLLINMTWWYLRCMLNTNLNNLKFKSSEFKFLSWLYGTSLKYIHLKEAYAIHCNNPCHFAACVLHILSLAGYHRGFWKNTWAPGTKINKVPSWSMYNGESYNKSALVHERRKCYIEYLVKIYSNFVHKMMGEIINLDFLLSKFQLNWWCRCAWIVKPNII